MTGFLKKLPATIGLISTCAACNAVVNFFLSKSGCITEKPNQELVPCSSCVITISLNFSLKYFAFFLLSSIIAGHFANCTCPIAPLISNGLTL